ncbi:MarR family transcriptional regulator [Nitratireductor sp. CAU 1489]|uniref:MarR family transcriptional regulator n=1 Tax=Nitratireductor arenosus TaxID=2682096 RepID=A0A844QGH2_9HYPH|nr:MarR family transcriptional regulator [Nitratireductor arenosus]MVA98375.1 MarR family transcriptional regulator [Nitratireductor arenosus]
MNDRAATTERGEEDNFLDMPGHLLRRCHQIGVAVFLDECSAVDLTPLQFGLLAALDRFGAMDQASLGRVAALDRTTIVVVLGKLAQRDLVTRTPSRKDRRSKIVAITGAGRDLLARALPLARQAQERMVEPLSSSERTQLIGLLAKMADGNNRLSRAPHSLPRV